MMKRRRLCGFSIATVVFMFICGIPWCRGAEGSSLDISPNCVVVPNTRMCRENDRAGRDLLFDQSATGLFAFCSSQWDSVFPFYSKIADNFSLTFDADIDSVVWWGGYWSMQQNSLVDFWVEFFAESTGLSQPKQDPSYSERVSFTEIDLGGYYRYEACIPPFSVSAGEQYWITFMATIVFPPHWGNNCSWPANTPGWGDGQECYFKSDMFGYPEWTDATTALGEPYESSFQLYESQTGCGEDENRNHAGIALLQNVPNPFIRDYTIISYTTSHRGHTRLSIYDSSGKLIAVLIDRIEEQGVKRASWDGRDGNKRCVGNGSYFYRLDVGNVSITRKMIVVR